jgi:hypothetical protein
MSRWEESKACFYRQGSNNWTNPNINNYVCLSIAWSTVQHEEQGHPHCNCSIAKEGYQNYRTISKHESTVMATSKPPETRHRSLQGCVAKFQICSTELGVLSWGACRMIIVDPTMQRPQPSTPTRCNFSFSVKWARTALHITKIIRNIQRHIHIQNKPPEASATIPHNNAECTQRRDEDRRRKHVSNEICNLSNKHWKFHFFNTISAQFWHN